MMDFRRAERLTPDFAEFTLGRTEGATRGLHPGLLRATYWRVGARAMVGWLKRTFGGDKPQTPKTVDEVMSAYGTLLEKYPIAIMDVAMLPIPKKQMKVLLKALYAKATTADLQNHIEVGFTLLSKFQEGVGATPIDGRITSGGKLLTQAELANLEKWMAWEKLSMTEAEALLAEWKGFLAGEPI